MRAFFVKKAVAIKPLLLAALLCGAAAANAATAVADGLPVFEPAADAFGLDADANDARDTVLKLGVSALDADADVLIARTPAPARAQVPAPAAPGLLLAGLGLLWVLRRRRR